MFTNLPQPRCDGNIGDKNSTADFLPLQHTKWTGMANAVPAAWQTLPAVAEATLAERARVPAGWAIIQRPASAIGTAVPAGTAAARNRNGVFGCSLRALERRHRHGLGYRNCAKAEANRQRGCSKYLHERSFPWFCEGGFARNIAAADLRALPVTAAPIATAPAPMPAAPAPVPPAPTPMTAAPAPMTMAPAADGPSALLPASADRPLRQR